MKRGAQYMIVHARGQRGEVTELVRSAVDSANARPADQFCSMDLVSIHSRGPRVRLAQ